MVRWRWAREFLGFLSCQREGCACQGFFLRSLGQHTPAEDKTCQLCLCVKRCSLNISNHITEIWLHPNFSVWISPQSPADNNRDTLPASKDDQSLASSASCVPASGPVCVHVKLIGTPCVVGCCCSAWHGCDDVI